MKELIEKIRMANKAYANGMPYLTDQEYDELWRELYAIDPTNPILYHTSQGPDIPPDHIKHTVPIRGVQKAFTMDDLKPFLTRHKGVDLIIQPKYDGVAAVIYRNPEGSSYPCSMALFGDGIKGRDVSCHLPKIEHLTPFGSFRQVELIIPNDVWDEAYGANPRNTVAGWINSSEIKQENIIIAMPHDFTMLEKQVPTNEIITDELLLSLYSAWNKSYPMDGLMIKVADPHERLKVGDNGTYYHWSIAWKPPIQTKTTTVVDIHWSVSRNGRVIPKVEYEPIELCGTTNKFATGNNAKWLDDKAIGVGSEIIVGKAGEIIPKIIEVIESNSILLIPHTCPICDEPLHWKGVDLVCNGRSCVTQLAKRLAYFYSDKGMDVKSIGEAMLRELLYNPYVRTILKISPWALLEPDTYNILADLYSIWGDARTDTYLESVESINKRKDPARFIAALGYPGLAYKTAIKIYHTIKGHKVKSHISSKAVGNFNKALNQLIEAKMKFSFFKLAPLPEPAKITYCITGELSSPRSDMIEYLSTKGWQFSNQVSKFTDLLIIGDLKRRTTKYHKALELSIKTIREEELSKYLKEN